MLMKEAMGKVLEEMGGFRLQQASGLRSSETTLHRVTQQVPCHVRAGQVPAKDCVYAQGGGACLLEVHKVRPHASIPV